MQAFSFELRQQYLMMLANGQIRRADEEDALTHHVFINMNTALLHNVWPVFEGEPFTMAIATRPLPSHPVDSSVL